MLAVAAAVAPSSALAAPQTVSILDDGYVPATVTVDRGDIVTWVNNGANLHTVTADEGTAMESGEMQRGGVFATKFDKAGRYPYHDDVNPKLTGVVVVLDTAQPASTDSSATTTEATPLQAAETRRAAAGRATSYGSSSARSRSLLPPAASSSSSRGAVARTTNPYRSGFYADRSSGRNRTRSVSTAISAPESKSTRASPAPMASRVPASPGTTIVSPAPTETTSTRAPAGAPIASRDNRCFAP